MDSTTPDHEFAGQIMYTHVKYIAFTKKGKKFPEEHWDYSLEEDLG